MASPISSLADRLGLVYIVYMATNDNSVNIVRRYHHGDLRGAVLSAGMAHLERDGVEVVSLRELAREVGVSAPALYRHFPSKDALLDALAGEGFDLLGTEQRAASDEAGGGRAGFAACGRAYVEFALGHPALFRLMSVRMPIADPLAAPIEQVPLAIRFLRESIDDLLPPRTSPLARRAAALNAWSLVHGLSLLMLDGPIERDDVLLKAVIEGAAASFA